MESIQRGGKNNLYIGNFNNDNTKHTFPQNDNSKLRKDEIGENLAGKETF